MRAFLNYFTGLFFGEREYKNWQIALFIFFLVGVFAVLTTLYQSEIQDALKFLCFSPELYTLLLVFHLI